MQKLPLSVLVLMGAILLVLSVSAGISLGSAPIPIRTVWAIVLNQLHVTNIAPDWSQGRESIVWDVRAPRVLLASFVGAGLAVVGAVLQPLTRNPLADPHLLGISSGAAAGAIIALLHTGLVLGLLTVPLFAFIGAMAATIAVLSIARLTTSATADRLVLVGVAISFVVAAGANLLIFLGDPRAAHTVVFWMLGGLGLAQWSHLVFPAGCLLLCLALILPNAGKINALALGDETATSLGVPVRSFRLSLFVVTSLLTGVMVAFSGAIGFVGLMIPHFSRMLTGSDSLRVVTISAFLGAIALIWADIAARTVMAPEDMPIGVVTGLIGGICFVMLMRRSH